MKKIASYSKCIILISSVLLSSCAAVRTSPLDSSAVVKSVRRDILSTGNLSPESVQVIRMAGLNEDEAVKNGADFLRSDIAKELNSPLKQFYAGSEIALDRALSLEKSNPQEAQAFFLRAGYLAYQGMMSPDCSQNVNLLCDNFKIYYLRSTLALLNMLKNNKWDSDKLPELRVGNEEKYLVTVKHDKQYEAPEDYDSITASALIGTEGLANRHVRYGIGLPLTACRGKRADAPFDRYLPKVGTCLPLTAVLTFNDIGDSKIEANVEFQNAFNTDVVNIGDKVIPLAANFTAPFASIVEKTGIGEFDGLFSAFSDDEKLLDQTGFFSVEPYASDKIPLVTVHGLFSSPATWLSLHNDLMSDPVIRQRYQVWHYLYPTNLPILENAATFRKKLDELEQHLRSASNQTAGARGMVVIAHSMGGLLTRTAIAKEDKTIQESLFASPEKIKELDEESQLQLGEMLGFGRKPYISRVVFVAVPHRGSPVSESWIGSIGKSLIYLPKKVLQKTVNLTSKIKDFLRPELASSLDGQDPTSVRGLSPTSPAIQIIAKLAVDANVPFHSIIGNSGKEGPKELSTDGVVLYQSSHLDGATSEYIVPAEHSAHSHPLAVQEIRRILRLHLSELDKSIKK